jgi:hypothetical protein
MWDDEHHRFLSRVTVLAAALALTSNRRLRTDPSAGGGLRADCRA